MEETEGEILAPPSEAEVSGEELELESEEITKLELPSEEELEL